LVDPAFNFTVAGDVQAPPGGGFLSVLRTVYDITWKGSYTHEFEKANGGQDGDHEAMVLGGILLCRVSCAEQSDNLLFFVPGVCGTTKPSGLWSAISTIPS
jgi:hypothetical protein